MPTTPLLQMQAVRKTFGSVVALNEVNLHINRNEIHGLLGGNGAGKTTLMNVLYGLYKPDSGQIRLDGQPVEIHSPRDAIRQGIGMVHQHFLQVDTYTVLENIVLGTAIKNRPTMQLAEAEQRVKALADQFGLAVKPQAMLETLPMGARQRVEILKALYRGIKILILDEPTTNLTPQEVDSLFESLRVMVSQGMSVVFITHKLGEVMSACDRITVLREGQSVLTLDRAAASPESLVQAMVGDELDVADSLLFSTSKTVSDPPDRTQPPILAMDAVTVLGDNRQPLLEACSLAVYPNEIVGIAGVAGNGQRELAESILGLQAPSAGRISIAGVDAAQTPTVKLLEKLVSYIPEDRLQDGFLPSASVGQNLILGRHRQEPYSKNGFLNWPVINRAARRLIGEYKIRTLGPDDTGANLSGGNIQRVMIARAFSFPAQLVVAHNPTQGLDIPSIEFVFSKLLAHKAAGGATLLISENLEELLLLCDRIATLYRGRIAGILARDEFDKYEIGRLMSGARIDS
ncbi:MAG: ABC transporter ATP-binding protein [Anaerolineae bacterium]|nr:ABC transporter ATP-binding protein [Anaerolineae bacterium]